MMKLGDSIDTLIQWLKWPTAALLTALLPGASLAFWDLLMVAFKHWLLLSPFFSGILAYATVWFVWLRRSRLSFFLTLEHELTHALFAWLTLHRVTNLKATLTRGGSMQFKGRGNWLIAIAPYFFPLLSVVLLVAIALAPDRLHDVLAFLLGASLAYHITGKWRQTHAGQTDLQKVGFLFALLVLPTANAVCTGVVIAGSVQAVAPGATDMTPLQFLQSVWVYTKGLF